jgi:hypothetical protein
MPLRYINVAVTAGALVLLGPLVDRRNVFCSVAAINRMGPDLDTLVADLSIYHI